MRILQTLDDWIGRSRPVLLLFGQLFIMILGIHLASDRLDDHLGQWLGAAPIPWPEPEWPLTVGTWVALGCEFATIVWAGTTLMNAQFGQRDNTPWAQRLHVNLVVAALGWLPVAFAGAWVVEMVVEDALAPWLGWWPGAMQALGWIAAGIVAWRAGLTGWWQVTRHSPKPKHWSEGWPWVPLVGGVTALAIRHGLPLWGWM
ncbi:MAG: hypothetical protein AAGA48_05765 [Myxococcota bacterium]